MCLRRFALPSRRTNCSSRPQADRLRPTAERPVVARRGEYERIASQSDDPALRSEALLDAGDSTRIQFPRSRLDAYNRYVKEFPKPVETAIETRFKIAEMYKAAHDETLYHKQLEEIVSAERPPDRKRPARTGRLRRVRPRPRRAALWGFRRREAAATLRDSLQDKKQRMDATVAALSRLVDYGIDEVTAAATYYMARPIQFQCSLLESERPDDLKPEDLEEFKNKSMRQRFRSREAIKVHEKKHGVIARRLFTRGLRKSQQALRADAGPLRETRNEQRLPRRDRQSCGGVTGVTGLQPLEIRQRITRAWASPMKCAPTSSPP